MAEGCLSAVLLSYRLTHKLKEQINFYYVYNEMPDDNYMYTNLQCIIHAAQCFQACGVLMMALTPKRLFLSFSLSSCLPLFSAFFSRAHYWVNKYILKNACELQRVVLYFKVMWCIKLALSISTPASACSKLAIPKRPKLCVCAHCVQLESPNLAKFGFRLQTPGRAAQALDQDSAQC